MAAGRARRSQAAVDWVLDLEPIEVNIFRGCRPRRTASGSSGARSPARRWSPRPARSSRAAGVHSLHAYFLRAGDPGADPLRGRPHPRRRSFTTRRVVAIQHGKAIFNLPASFQVPEEGLDHAFPMPDVPRPTAPGLHDRVASPPGRDGRPGSTGRGPSTSATSTAPPPTAGPAHRVPQSVAAGRRPAARRPAAAHHRAHLRADMTLLDTATAAPRRQLVRPTTASWPASTTPCGSTGPSGPTTGCSTTRTAPSAPAARGLSRGLVFTRDGHPRGHGDAGGPDPLGAEWAQRGGH